VPRKCAAKQRPASLPKRSDALSLERLQYKEKINAEKTQCHKQRREYHRLKLEHSPLGRSATRFGTECSSATGSLNGTAKTTNKTCRLCLTATKKQLNLTTARSKPVTFACCNTGHTGMGSLLVQKITARISFGNAEILSRMCNK